MPQHHHRSLAQRLRPAGSVTALTGAVSAALVLFAGLTPAHAQAAEKGRHCVTNVSVPNTPTTCYDSFTVAIAKATDGRVTDAPDNAQKAVNDRRFEQRLNATGTKKGSGGATALALSPISIMYRDADFRGASWIISGNFDCTGPTDNWDYWMPYVGDSWNDDIGSYHAYRNCWLMLFEHRDFGGGSIPFAGDRTDLGILDDKVSSIVWS
jgi:hypothetical protein